METITYIIGDIHGQAEMLERLLAAIESRHKWKAADLAGRIVFLGDYIDRGPDSKGVIDLAITGLPEFESIFLKGNHEQLLIEVINSDERNVWNNWISAGGEVTLKSFGYDLFRDRYDSNLLREILGKNRVDWLDKLLTIYPFEDIVCVHAGLNPNVPISEQDDKDMLWIRKRFLDSNYDFGVGVVHGHTPHDRPVVKPNRICLDTGAGMGGPLTALVVDKPWAEIVAQPDFISVV